MIYSGKSVLIMEDDMILTFSLELMLRRAGIERMLCTRTGEEAITLASEQPVDLIIADIYLGEGINGTEAVRRIQSMKQIPVIYITGNSDTQNRKEAARTDYVEYLVKPITSDQLHRSLSRVWTRNAV